MPPDLLSVEEVVGIVMHSSCLVLLSLVPLDVFVAAITVTVYL